MNWAIVDAGIGLLSLWRQVITCNNDDLLLNLTHETSLSESSTKGAIEQIAFKYAVWNTAAILLI